MKLEITPLDAPLGAMVRGWNPKAELSFDDLGLLRQAMHEHLVLVFRGHATPTDAELVRFAGRFGELQKAAEMFGDLNPIAEILPVNNLRDDDGAPKGTGESMALEWHSDYSFQAVVGKESFLEAVELPRKNGPRTYFCSQYAALERLPRTTVEKLRRLTAYHSLGENYREGFRDKRDYASQGAEHPVILRHPDTGREILYVGKVSTRHIIGMPKDESDVLVKHLVDHSTQPESVYAHDWQVGDFVVFDVLGTLHSRDAWDPAERRVMRQLSTLWTPPAREAHAAA